MAPFREAGSVAVHRRRCWWRRKRGRSGAGVGAVGRGIGGMLASKTSNRWMERDGGSNFVSAYVTARDLLLSSFFFLPFFAWENRVLGRHWGSHVYIHNRHPFLSSLLTLHLPFPLPFPSLECARNRGKGKGGGWGVGGGIRSDIRQTWVFSFRMYIRTII